MRNLIFILLLQLPLYSQNLVPNPSFEIYTDLPTSLNNGHVEFATPWFEVPASPWLTGASSSTEYFNTTMPLNILLGDTYEIQSAQTGNAYAGFLACSPVDWRTTFENLEVQLISPMQVGNTYSVSYYISMSKSLYLVALCGWGSDELGIYFHTDTIYQADTIPDNHTNELFEHALTIVEGEYIPVIEQSVYSFVDYSVEQDMELDHVINNDEIWVRIQDTIYADKPYEFMVFSQFNPYSEIEWVENFDCFMFGNNASYFLIDDVSVHLIEEEHHEANTGADTLICFGDSIQIGTSALEDYMYWWSPNENIALDTFGYVNPGMPWVSPTETTQYILTQKDFAFIESIDTVSIYVSNTLSDCIQPDFIGENISMCLGDTLLMGSSNYPFFTYEWSPQTNLADPYAGITQFTPQATGVYFFNQLIFDSTGSFLSDIITVTVDCGQNLAEYYASQISISPNPAHDFIQIESPYSISSFVLYDEVGKMCKNLKGTINRSHVLDVSALASGMYFLELDIKGEKVIKRVLLSK